MQDANNIFMVSFVVLALFFAQLFLTEKKKRRLLTLDGTSKCLM